MKCNTHTHIHTGSLFGVDTVLFHAYTHSHFWWGCEPNDNLYSFLSAVRLLWFMKCPLVAPQSTHVISASFSFFADDCDVTLFPAWNRTCIINEKSMHWTTTTSKVSCPYIRTHLNTCSAILCAMGTFGFFEFWQTAHCTLLQ